MRTAEVGEAVLELRGDEFLREVLGGLLVGAASEAGKDRAAARNAARWSSASAASCSDPPAVNRTTRSPILAMSACPPPRNSRSAPLLHLRLPLR
jgi:hypothetical protein